jgi:hypothetical protein
MLDVEKKMSEKPKVTRTERGWGGHFIGVSRCRFRRNTLLECGEERIVVSTVGAATEDHGDEEQFSTIGLDRYYETAAFRAVKSGIYWEADVTKQVPFKGNWYISTLSETSDAEANDMHEAVVAELTEQLQNRARRRRA